MKLVSHKCDAATFCIFQNTCVIEKGTVLLSFKPKKEAKPALQGASTFDLEAEGNKKKRKKE